MTEPITVEDRKAAAWKRVEDALPNAKAIAWDTCHKTSLATLQEWFADSCALRFITAVHSVPEGEDPNEGFTDLIAQFEMDEDEVDFLEDDDDA